MKRNYLNKTKTGIKTFMAGLFLFGTLLSNAQCGADFTYTLGPNGSVNFESTSTGTTSSTYYSWNFAGSSGSGVAPSHTFSTNGYKMICLTIVADTNATNSCTSSACDSIQITNASTTTPCNADFTYTPGSNGSVSFVSTSTGTSASTTYSWDFGDSTSVSGIAPTHTYTSNGLYWICLTITDSVTSCTSTYCDSLFISNTSSTTPCNPSVVYTLAKDTNIALTWYAFPSYPSNVTNATWYWGDGSSTTGLYPSHTYSAAGTYSTCVTISVSCGTITATYCYVAAIFRSGENNDMILVNVRPALGTGIKNQVKTEGQLSVYPNPNNGEFVLELKGAGNELKENTVFVYNMLGEKVLEKHVLTNGKQTIDVSNLANGSYLVKINSDTGSLHKKITIQR